MKYLIKYASRSRPENFERGLISIIENANDLSKITILVSLDYVGDPNHPEYDDKRFFEYMTVIEKYWSKVHIKVKADKSNNKIHAINRDVNDYKAHWDILINFSDDMIFTLKGWDSIITEEYKSNFPNGCAVMHFPDLNVHDALMTMSIMDRKYYDLDEYIYNPEYISVWCDNEAQEVAKLRGCYKFINLYIFDHLHPAYRKAPNDLQYKKTEAVEVHAKDKATFDRRKQNKFYVQSK